MLGQLQKRGPVWWLLVCAGLLVTLVSSYFVVKDVRWNEVGDALATSNLLWLGPALAALAVGVFLRAVRWRTLYASERRPPLRATFEALLVGYLFNTLLPVRAGEAARIVALHRRAGISRAESAGTVMVERVYDVASLLVLLFAALPWLPEVSWLLGAGVLGALLALGLVAAVVLLAVFGDEVLLPLARPLGRLPFIAAGTPERLARNLARGLSGLRRTRAAAAAFGWTTASWLVIALSCWLVTIGFDLKLAPVAGLLVTIAIGLAMILPSSPGAVGVFEGATVVALGAYDVSDSRALSFALVLHLLNFVPFVVAGLWALRATTSGSRPRPEAA